MPSHLIPTAVPALIGWHGQVDGKARGLAVPAYKSLSTVGENLSKMRQQKRPRNSIPARILEQDTMAH